MAKSAIIKEIVNNEIKLEVALNRTKIIVSDLKNIKLEKWLSNEILGYSSDSAPDYRIVHSSVFKYSGLNGGFQVTNQDLPLHYFPDEIQEHISNVTIADGISEMESKIADDIPLGRSLTQFAAQVYQKTGIRCFEINQYIDKTIFKSILAHTKNRLIDILLKLEKEFGSLDELDIDVSTKTEKDIENINQTIVQILVQDNSIKVGDKNKITKSLLGKKGE